MDIAAGAFLEDLERHIADIVHQIAALAHIDEAAGNDIGTADDMAVINVQRRDDNDQAVLTEVLSVAQNDRTDVADAESVDKYLACGDGVDLFHAVLGQLNDLADIADIDILAVHADTHREVHMLSQVLLLSVYGDEVPRLDQRMDEL